MSHFTTSTSRFRLRPVRPPYSKADERSTLRDILPAGAIFVLLLASLASSYLLTAGDDRQYFVVAPPAWGLARTINELAAADGRLVSQGRFSNIVFASSDQPDFRQMLGAAGAWIVLPVPAQGGCGSVTKNGSVA